MPNLSSVVNYFATPNEGFATTLGSTISSGAVTVPLAGTSGLTNGSIFVGIIEPGATNQQVFTGIVDTGGSQITSVVWTRGTNNSHVGGVSIVDYVTGTAFGMLSKGILVEHNQSGTHGAITSTNATLTTPTIITPTTKGTVDGWIGANESWTYASATTITVPTDATTKYDIGDYIKLTQSSTVKYFVITSLTSTVLTVAGLGGATVANAAISLNSYSKTRNPHGSATGGLPFNPYKFSAYRSAALAQASNAIVIYDTKLFDTGTNYSVSTGLFTAPIAGFYKFDAAVQIASSASFVFNVGLQKNASGSLLIGNYFNGTTAIQGFVVNSPPIQLAANDTIGVIFGSNNGGNTTFQVGAAQTWFGGFLVSAT